MKQPMDKLRFFTADGASVNSGVLNGIPEVLMRRHPNMLLVFIWCIGHVLNLCLISFSKTIAKHDMDIFKHISRVGSYLNLNKANFREALEELKAADTTLIRKGEPGRFASFCQPIREMVERWGTLQQLADRMVAQSVSKKRKPKQIPPPPTPPPVPAAAPPVLARRSTRATRCQTNMGCVGVMK